MWVPMGVVDASDDVLHVAEDDAAWSEHHYFFFADDASGRAGGCRVAWRDGRATGMVFLFLDDGVAVWHQEAGDDRLRAGPLVLSGEPLGTWHVAFDADMLVVPDGRALAGLAPAGGEMVPRPVRLDLRFTPGAPAVQGTPNGEASALVADIAPRRFEQAGRYEGSAVVGDDKLAWSGFGIRDHSWGARDPSRLREWTWCALPLGAALCGGAGRVVLDDGEIRSAWQARDGVLVEVTDADIDLDFDGGQVPVGARVRMVGPGDESRVFEGTVVAPLAMRTVEHGRNVLAVESLTRYVCDGITGYGVAEYVRTDGP